MATFLANEMNENGDPHFLFLYFDEDNILYNREENYQKSMATFLANETNTTERYTSCPDCVSVKG